MPHGKLDSRELSDKAVSKNKVKKSSSSNLLIGVNVDPKQVDKKAVDGGHKGFFNFMNNTFDDLKKKNRKSNTVVFLGDFDSLIKI